MQAFYLTQSVIDRKTECQWDHLLGTFPTDMFMTKVEENEMKWAISNLFQY